MTNRHNILNKVCWYAVPGSSGADYFGPVAFNCRASSGGPPTELIGTKRRYPQRRRDKNILCLIGSVPRCIGLLLWVNKEPLLDEHGKLAVDGDGFVITPATHIAVKFDACWDVYYQITAAAAPAPAKRRK